MLISNFKNQLGFLLVLILGLSGCLGGGQAPVYTRDGEKNRTTEQKPIPQRSIPRTRQTRDTPQARKGHYIVVRGDTLYSIAWRYQLDYKKLASWNGIRSPYLIRVGQDLRLKPSSNQKRSKAILAKKTKVISNSKPTVVVTSKPPQIKKKVTQTTQVSRAETKSNQALKKIAWKWPAKGKLISSNTVSARNGIDIKGKMGQTVKAAAGGKVVYSGNGLVGYGNLIIIKHNKSFLSAYAHNSHLLVSEGTSVSTGQPIAEMGNSGTNKIKLHFEIRKDGKSVNPIKYLPK